MTKNERALLEAILAAPADDAPRLAYADWLTARGDPRGEFIRVECERVRVHNDGNVLDRPRWDELRARDEELQRQHGAEWRAPLAKHFRTFSFSRGFPSLLFVGGEELLAAERALALAPIDSLSLSGDLKPTIVRVAAMPALARVLELGLHPTTPDTALGEAGFALVARANLANLRVFECGANGLGDAALVALAASSWLGRLTKLTLGGNPFGDAGVTALAAAGMTRLAWLSLPSFHIGTAGVRALAESPSLGAVVMLDLCSACAADDGIAALARSPHLGALRELRLRTSGCGPAGARALATAPERATLERLDLSSNAIGADGARAFAGSTTLARLRTLDLSNNQLGVDGVDALARGTGLPALAELGIAGNIETDEVEDWVDWTGSVVGSGPKQEAWHVTQARFAARPNLKIL